jgi:hypothetical protein
MIAGAAGESARATALSELHYYADPAVPGIVRIVLIKWSLIGEPAHLHHLSRTQSAGV